MMMFQRQRSLLFATTCLVALALSDGAAAARPADATFLRKRSDFTDSTASGDDESAVLEATELAPQQQEEEAEQQEQDSTPRACDDFEGEAWNLCFSYCEAQDCEDQEGGCDAVKSQFSLLTGQSSMPCEGCPCWESLELDTLTAIAGLGENNPQQVLCYEKESYVEIDLSSSSNSDITGSNDNDRQDNGPLSLIMTQSGEDLPKMCMNFLGANHIIRHLTSKQAARCREELLDTCKKVDEVESKLLENE